MKSSFRGMYFNFWIFRKSSWLSFVKNLASTSKKILLCGLEQMDG